VRGRIEKILGWAKVNNYREGENPARWRDNLDQLLPKLSEVRTVRHHPALPYAELVAFMEKLRKEESTAARALEFAILTAARTEEVILARPGEVNRREKLWTAPAEHMKLKRAHLVPLPDRATRRLARRICLDMPPAFFVVTSFAAIAASAFEGVWKVKDTAGHPFEITLCSRSCPTTYLPNWRRTYGNSPRRKAWCATPPA
jgi:integrase